MFNLHQLTSRRLLLFISDDKTYLGFAKLTSEVWKYSKMVRSELLIRVVASVLTQTLSYSWNTSYPQTSPWTRLLQTSCDFPWVLVSSLQNSSPYPQRLYKVSFKRASALILGVCTVLYTLHWVEYCSS